MLFAEIEPFHSKPLGCLSDRDIQAPERQNSQCLYNHPRTVRFSYRVDEQQTRKGGKELSEEKKLTFSTQNSIDILQDDPDMLIVSLDLMHIGENRNKCDIPKEAIEASLDTIPNKPIAFRYNKPTLAADDVTEHARDQKQLFETRIAGHIPTDSRLTFVTRPNGKTYLNAEGVVQKKYLPVLVDILRKHKGKMKVSVEFLATGVQDEETGIFRIEKFKFQCVMILSDTVLEGIEGSALVAEDLTQNDVAEMNSRYFSFAARKNANIIEEIKNIKKEEQTKVVKLTMRQLEDKIWSKLKDYTYRDGEWIGKRYWIIDLDAAEKVAYIHDNQTDADYKVPYSVDKNGDVNVELDGKKEVEQTHEWKEKTVKNSWTFAKDEYGKGSKIEIDRSKEALSNDEWGAINKTDLRNKVLDAENYKELVKAVYLVVEDGWEDAPSQKLKYPVMQIKGGKAVYNRNALASALGYAKANNETEVVGTIMKLYKELGIEDGSEEKSVENKLDKDNPELEKIRDDADAIEDEAKKNAIDEPEEKKLQDDVDADKDYWKKKHEETNAALEKANCDYAELEAKYAELTKVHAETCAKLDVFEKAEAKRGKIKYLNTYRNAFDSSEYEVIAKKIENEEESCDQFCAFVDSKMLEKSKKQYGFVDEMKNAYDPANGYMGIFSTAKESNAEKQKITLDDIIEKSQKK